MTGGGRSLALFADQRFRQGPRSKHDRLIEFLAVDKKTQRFGGADIAWQSMRKERFMGWFALRIYSQEDAASAFCTWTAASVERVMAMIVDGEAVSAARIASRLPGNGMGARLPENRIDGILESRGR